MSGEHGVLRKLIDGFSRHKVAVFIIPACKIICFTLRRRKLSIRGIKCDALVVVRQIFAAVGVKTNPVLIGRPLRHIGNALVHCFGNLRIPAGKGIPLSGRLLAVPCRRRAALGGVIYLIFENHSI